LVQPGNSSKTRDTYQYWTIDVNSDMTKRREKGDKREKRSLASIRLDKGLDGA
jgi:hypothetical protein